MRRPRAGALRHWLAAGLLWAGLITGSWQAAAGQTAEVARTPTPLSAPPALLELPSGVSRDIRVAVKPLEPFAVRRNGEWAGFSIELWQHVARQLGLTTTWVDVETVQDQLAAVRDGRADAAIAGITMTAEREQTVDFTHPFFDAGLQVLAADTGQPEGVNILESYTSLLLLQILVVGILFAVALAHIIWLIERRENPEFQKGYRRGVWEGLWWVQAVIATGEYPSQNTRSALKRVMTIGFWLIGVLLIAQFTAAVTSDMTVEMLDSEVSGPSDLPGKQVVTVAGTTAADWLQKEQIAATEVMHIEDAFKLIEDGQADAIVFDAPVLQYYAATRGIGKAHVVGNVFRPEKYGIALPPDSPLRRPLNGAILQMYQDGSYDELYEWWFGSGGVPGG